jgi:hypothetical protein
MKISFPKYGPGELLTRNRGTTRIISFVAIAFFAGVCGSYLLANKLWLLTIAVLGIAGILLLLGARAAIFLNKSEVNETPSAPIEENAPRRTPQWDYRPTKARRARATLDSPSTETSDGLSSDLFVTTDNVWRNDDSLECTTPIFVNDPPAGEDVLASPPPQTTDPPCAVPTADDAPVWRTTKVL